MGVQKASVGKNRGKGRSAQHRVRKLCKWDEQEVKELSSLIFGYVQRNGGKLPIKSDAQFWAFCHEHFQGRFTAQQVHDKARHLKLRFLQLTSGDARSIKPSDRNIFNMWTHIMSFNPPPQVIDHNAGNGEEGQPEISSHPHPAARNPPSTQIPQDQAGRTSGTNDMEGPSKGKTPRAGGDKGGASAAGEARAREEEQDTSTCSSENVFEESQYSHHENYGTQTRHVGDDGHAAADHVGETPSHNMILFQHIIAADLASTTKTLAEFVHYQGQRA